MIIKKAIFLFWITWFFSIAQGLCQDNQNHKTLTQKEIEAQKLKKQEEADRLGKERHMGIQTKKVRRRMKKSSKQARKNNEKREEFILFKLFRRR